MSPSERQFHPSAVVFVTQPFSFQTKTLQFQRILLRKNIFRRSGHGALLFIWQRMHRQRHTDRFGILLPDPRIHFLEKCVVNALYAKGIKPGIRNGGKHRFLFGTDDCQLSAQAVHGKARPGAPALPAVAVTLFLIALKQGFDVLLTHLIRVPGGNHAFSAVQNTYRHPVQISQAHAQAGPALAASGRIAEPAALIHTAQRPKQPFLQKVNHFTAADPLHQRRQRLGAAGIIMENRTRLVGRFSGKEGL